ncbi:uncharacterized protein LOC117110342 isoform X3 [Anneissia japonica]|uniref:uncharacterized protein LOC117110342 isoform X3 n=1 Tax=Anneissia japonica TaxID=1529436 RepID=UPI00142593CB|nr:uncharacterized protein LOC117110342 isoform X3 [Anneissia japonica]
MEEITDDAFRQLLSFFSNWYDQRGWIGMLKVLYRDLFENKFELNKAAKVIDLMNLLIASGDLHSTYLSILYDTINITKQYGLEREIKDNLLPSFPNVRDVMTSKFTPHRQKIMKLGMVLIDDDIKMISGLYNKPKKYADTWSLIMDLEHNRIICEGNMDTFIEKLNTLKLQQAVEVFKEDIPAPNPSSNPGQASNIPKSPSNSGQASDIPNTSSNSGNRFGEDIQTPKPSLNPGQASDIPNAPSISGHRFSEVSQVASSHTRKKRRKVSQSASSYTSKKPHKVSQAASSHVGKKRRKGVKCTLKRKKKDYRPHPEYVLNLLKEFDKHKSHLRCIHLPECFAGLRSIVQFYKGLGLKLDEVEVGCIVFHLSTHDPNALLNLWEIHSSGKLIKDLTGILVPEKHQQEFLDEWMTYIDENEYKAALRILKEKGKNKEFKPI